MKNSKSQKVAMFKKVLIAAAIVIASPAFVSAQDIFWSLDSETLVTSEKSEVFELSGSAYIFSNGMFGFDAIDLNFTTSPNQNAIQFTGGEAFNPTTLLGERFDSSELTIAADGLGGNLFSVAVLGTGIDPVLAPFDPTFKPGVGPDGAFLLARVDFDIVGNDSVELDFTLGPQGVIQLPDSIINPSFGSVSLTFLPLTHPFGDLNGDFVVDFADIPLFISALSTGEFQLSADCNCDGAVNFFDIAPFIGFLNSP